MPLKPNLYLTSSSSDVSSSPSASVSVFSFAVALSSGVPTDFLHAAKGLEFDTVFMIQCNEGVIPYKKAKLDAELEEERRMFYVAMTRAKRKLIISYAK